MSPRSILKSPSQEGAQSTQRPAQSSSTYSAELPYPYPSVHFPPSPALTQTYPTHSVSAYDRHPIVVSPNDCALPERGCPGRTYDGHKPSKQPIKRRDGSTIHPRALECPRQPPLGERKASHRPMAASVPPLVPDLSSSSESDESDGLVSPPPETVFTPHIPMPHHTNSSPIPSTKALSFLPHPPSPSSEKEKRRRKLQSSEQKFKSGSGVCSFAASSLDGCLGGF
ncbi:hypothetical protein BD410DRAFT_520045 [Rickenella mellea]|uniref:Uncharacterized protein n=1 Tax=Rickenella mellea TaxID=50990 RepID=A0A4Y7QGT4_9AGAM|nr:hypothetical protein BD410DRAFT_520045 [Rickenella mellea]